MQTDTQTQTSPPLARARLLALPALLLALAGPLTVLGAVTAAAACAGTPSPVADRATAPHAASAETPPSAEPASRPAGAITVSPAADRPVPVADADVATTAYFAGGCFWGVEALLEAMDGVVDVTSGYMGGRVDDPTYKQVSYEGTGHAEAVRVTFDPDVVPFRALAKRFFEIHDPTQLDRQGPDVGDQYRSAVFPLDEAQRQAVEGLMGELRDLGYDVVTEVEPPATFWPAETYHQDYYARTGKAPYCHAPVPRFDRRAR